MREQSHLILRCGPQQLLGLTCPKGPCLHRATNRGPGPLARPPLAPPGAEFAPDHAADALAARYRTGPPTSPGHRFTASVLSSRGPAGTPRFHLPVEESFLRSALASGRQAHRSALRSARPDPPGDLLGRQTGRRSAVSRCGRQLHVAAPENGGSIAMWESFFGFNKTPFGDSPDAKQLFAAQAWNQVETRL